MLLVGVNRSPYTRRVAITLKLYGMPSSSVISRASVIAPRCGAANPLGRIPALVLDDGETLVDSSAIVDHLDQTHGGGRPLTPAGGADRRAVLRVAALMMGACDKGLQAAYERNHHPPEKVHQPWIDDCLAQMRSALSAVEAMIDPTTPYLLLGRITQADVTAFIAERLARAGLKIDTASEMPRLHALAMRLLEEPAFRSTEP